MAVYTTDQYQALIAAIATGSKFVKYSDKEVEYRSLGDMLSLKHEMELDLGLIRKPTRTTHTRYRKIRNLGI
jgi:hypothetical protein